MLTIRMQRGGRSGHPQYRVVVQDSRFSPTSGRIVAQVGTYDPHSKATNLDVAKIENYLANGAQPSDRVVSILRANNVKLPSWVKVASPKTSTTRNVGKLRRNTPEAPAEEVAEEAPAEVAEAEQAEAPAETEATPAEA